MKVLEEKKEKKDKKEKKEKKKKRRARIASTGWRPLGPIQDPDDQPIQYKNEFHWSFYTITISHQFSYVENPLL